MSKQSMSKAVVKNGEIGMVFVDLCRLDDKRLARLEADYPEVLVLCERRRGNRDLFIGMGKDGSPWVVQSFRLDAKDLIEISYKSQNSKNIREGRAPEFENPALSAERQYIALSMSSDGQQAIREIERTLVDKGAGDAELEYARRKQYFSQLSVASDAIYKIILGEHQPDAMFVADESNPIQHRTFFACVKAVKHGVPLSNPDVDINERGEARIGSGDFLKVRGLPEIVQSAYIFAEAQLNDSNIVLVKSGSKASKDGEYYQAVKIKNSRTFSQVPINIPLEERCVDSPLFNPPQSENKIKICGLLHGMPPEEISRSLAENARKIVSVERSILGTLAELITPIKTKTGVVPDILIQVMTSRFDLVRESLRERPVIFREDLPKFTLSPPGTPERVMRPAPLPPPPKLVVVGPTDHPRANMSYPLHNQNAEDVTRAFQWLGPLLSTKYGIPPTDETRDRGLDSPPVDPSLDDSSAISVLSGPSKNQIVRDSS